MATKKILILVIIMNTKVLIIDSKDRVNYETTNSNNFRIKFSQPLYDQNKSVLLELSSIILPKTYFHVNSSNNSFVVDMQGDTTYIVTLTSGFYTITSLCSHLQTELNASGGPYANFTVTYASSTQTVTITGGLPPNFKLQNSECMKLFGLYLLADDSYALSVASNGSLQFLASPIYLYLDVVQFGKNIYDSTNKPKCSFVIPLQNQTINNIDLESNVYLNYLDLSPCNTVIQIDDPRLNFIDLCLYDSDFNIVNLNYSDWIAIFKIRSP